MTNLNFIETLDQRLLELERELEKQPYWLEFTAPDLPNAARLEVMKNIMREIWTYQIEVNRSVFTAVGRLGDQVADQALIRAMIAVQIEEVGHGTVALDDFYKLGGTDLEKEALANPASLAIIAVVRHLGEHCHPLCHLGFMYLFEKFTTIMTDKVMPYLEEAYYPNESLIFMRLHAEEDIRHAEMLAEVIEASLDRFEDCEKHVKYGFDCFLEVYPHRLWAAAVDNCKVLSDA